MKFKLFGLLLGIFSFGLIHSQELNCQVTVQAAPSLQISAVDKEIFSQMETSIFEFINNSKWTQDVYEIEERINCNILVTITEMPSTDTYGGQIQIQSSRPTFNSSYNTQAFYAYMILGYDYDSFSLEGGSQWFTKAQQIVLNAQTSGYSGWNSAERSRRNRYWLVDNALHQIFKPLRKCMYIYHREGIDKLYENPEQARKTIYKSLSELNKVHASKPGSPNVSIFLNNKVDELKNVYADGTMQEKNQIVNLLKRIDPANSGRYQEILK